MFLTKLRKMAADAKNEIPEEVAKECSFHPKILQKSIEIAVRNNNFWNKRNFLALEKI